MSELGVSAFTPEAVFPRAYLSKQEVGLQIRVTTPGDDEPTWTEPYHLVSSRRRFIPPDLSLFGCWLQNGGCLSYTSSTALHGQITNLTPVTPECASPEQLHLHIRASQYIVTRLLERYVEAESGRHKGMVEARLQNRVVDGRGNRKGARDYFALPVGSSFETKKLSSLYALTEHIATSQFITGAGFNCGGEDLRFAQKTGGLTAVTGSGYTGTMVDSGTVENVMWVQSRNADVNIMDWAIRARIVGSAIVLALLHSPLTDKVSNPYLTDEQRIKRAMRMNVLRLTDDGGIESTRSQRQAVGSQRRNLDLFLGELPLHTDVPAAMLADAHELYRYVDGYYAVLQGKQNISSLDRRSDWATKFTRTIEIMARQRAGGVKRSLGDAPAVSRDFKYDYALISAIKGELQPPIYGYGYGLRQETHGKQLTQYTLPPKTAEAAAFRPPQDTRAVILAGLLKEFRTKISSAGPGFVEISVRGKKKYVSFPDPRQTELDPKQAKTLEMVRRRVASVKKTQSSR